MGNLLKTMYLIWSGYLWINSVIHNGIEVPHDEIDMPELFLNVKSNLWIGIVANLKPVKRIDLFIRALGILRDASPWIFMQLSLGKASQEQMLKELSEELGISSRVHLKDL